MAYSSLSSSTTIVTAHAPPSAVTHLSVAPLELCDTTMHWIFGYLFATVRSSRKVFSATTYISTFGITPSQSDYLQAHPVFRKKQIMAGLLSGGGSCNFIALGALPPITGATATSTGGGTGVAQECHDFGTERFANGLANGRSSFCALGSLELLFLDSNCEVSKAFDGIPAFFKAILVVSLANILCISVGAIQTVVQGE